MSFEISWSVLVSIMLALGLASDKTAGLEQQ
jgi:hypothetical protein